MLQTEMLFATNQKTGSSEWNEGGCTDGRCVEGGDASTTRGARVRGHTLVAFAARTDIDVA
jgi:hypothetical protein